ncbi:ATP-binding protein [Lacticaseibacillus porcinae]|uniref:ATP-binding protein n=1 Tax=Lacticaseibacillus porcinae TaxID=1123687 RepID=UPI000F7A1932|nr:ATP-binding protein [Lacticaseibacillus porcinae]
MRQKNLPPNAANLIESTRSIGYSFEMALADIIDNSISNGARNVSIQFSLEDAPENAYVSVLDDGVGMNSDALASAMRYGSSDVHAERDHNDLGRFGLGLKMASMSQCRQLTVVSKQHGELTAAQWDLDHIHQTQEWSLQLYSADEISQFPGVAALKERVQGTLILWMKLDQISDSPESFSNEFARKMDYASQHLALVFHRYLETMSVEKRLTISMNGRELKPIDPFLRSNSFTQVLEEQALLVDRKVVKITPFIMPFASNMSVQERNEADSLKGLGLNQGLYIYRNHRLIVWGKWFRLIRDSELRRLARVQIDLPNSLDDYWKIDVKKSTAQVPAQLRERIKQIVIKAVGKSERVYSYRGRKLETSSFDDIWEKIDNRGNESYLIDRGFPVVSAFRDGLNDSQARMFEGVLKIIEEGFPFMSVYYDVANDHKLESTPIEDERAYELAKQTISALATTLGSTQDAYRALMKTEWIQKNSKVKKMLGEDYAGD